MDTQFARPLPFYAKVTLIILFLFLLLYGIYEGQGILLPLGFSFIFAVLLRPVEQFFLHIKCPKILSIVLTLLIAILLLILLVNFISNQVSSMAKDIPAIEKSLDNLFHQFQIWVKNNFHVAYTRQDEMIANAKEETMHNLSASGTFNIITASIATLMLIPIYIFLFLYYRMLFLEFIVEVFEKKYSENVRQIVGEVKNVIQHYVVGILFENTIVAVLNVIGLLLLGAPYAVLMGVLGAIINMIPFIGGMIQLILTALVVFANTNSLPKTIGTLIILLAIQFVDNHFLIPRIVGSRVKLNALISILGVLIGGALCGIGGMFLSIPFLAICKVIFDRVDNLKPWGKLLGGMPK